MRDPDLLPRLARHRTIGGAPPEELSWLAAHADLRHLDRGEVLAQKDRPVEDLWIVLSGAFAIHVDRGLGPRKVAEWHEGDALGLLPYSRMTAPPGTIVTLEPGEVLAVGSQHFPELVRECPVITATLVHVMLDRARVFTSSDLHEEKMMSLGRIAAGLAHELNNPASAATRSARLLTEAQAEGETASRSLAASRMTKAQLAAIDRVRAEIVGKPSPILTAVERMDREEVLASWLEAHGADPAAAASLVDTAATTEVMDDLAEVVSGEALQTAIRWLAVSWSIRALASDVERSASRVSDLVGAVKRFTYMDRQQAPEAIDLLQGVRDSVTMLAHKARDKSAIVGVDVEKDLPRVWAIGSDLNQVWTNLLDNALDAVPESGQVTIAATREFDRVVVRVIDNGPGIPAEILERIFDPFFTTKPVGQGTGLGLEIARRLVRRNGGDIAVTSRPGRTEFLVAVPTATGSAAAGAAQS